MSGHTERTAAEVVREGARLLESCGIDNAEHDSFMLLAQETGMDRTHYYTHRDLPVPDLVYAHFMDRIARRAEHEPLQHILGKAWFYGCEFEVNGSVLIPRQETEILVENALKRIDDGMNVLDLCTGSGCIILSIAGQKNLNAAVGADISKEALLVAERNRRRLKADHVRLIQSDLFDGLAEWKGRFDLIVSNPPYIRTADIELLSEEVRLHDPRLALDGAADGLHFYREITAQAPKYLKPGGWLLYETGSDQGAAVRALLNENGFDAVEVIRDLAGLERVVLGRISGCAENRNFEERK